jgi:hypothetical protein
MMENGFVSRYANLRFERYLDLYFRTLKLRGLLKTKAGSRFLGYLIFGTLCTWIFSKSSLLCGVLNSRRG